MQNPTFTLLKVFNLLIDLLIQLIKQGKETGYFPDDPGHLFSTYRFSGFFRIQNKEGPDQTVCIRRLVRVFAVYIWYKNPSFHFTSNELCQRPVSSSSQHNAKSAFEHVQNAQIQIILHMH